MWTLLRLSLIEAFWHICLFSGLLPLRLSSKEVNFHTIIFETTLDLMMLLSLFLAFTHWWCHPDFQIFQNCFVSIWSKPTRAKKQFCLISRIFYFGCFPLSSSHIEVFFHFSTILKIVLGSSLVSLQILDFQLFYYYSGQMAGPPGGRLD